MLEEGDCSDPFEEAFAVPPAEFFAEKRKDGTRRIVEIRVIRKNGVAVVTDIRSPRDGSWRCIEGKYDGPGSAKRLSQEAIPEPVRPDPETGGTPEIPTAEEAETVEASSVAPMKCEFFLPERAPKAAINRFWWIKPDGTPVPGTGQNLERLITQCKHDEQALWGTWTSREKYDRHQWYDNAGNLKILAEPEFKLLNEREQKRYRLERLLNGLEPMALDLTEIMPRPASELGAPGEAIHSEPEPEPEPARMSIKEIVEFFEGESDDSTMDIDWEEPKILPNDHDTESTWDGFDNWEE